MDHQSAGRAIRSTADFHFFAREMRDFAAHSPNLVPIGWLREAMADLLAAIEAIEAAQCGPARFVREVRS